MLIRYLLRNIYFFETTRRRSEADIILSNHDIEYPKILLNSQLGNILIKIIESDDCKYILESIAKSSFRKDEISSILKNYK